MATAGEHLPQTALPLAFEMEASEHDDGFSVFAEVRPRLFGIAYRMLGSAAEAEDIVQDVWVRWQSTDRSAVENPTAFLVKATTRLCINLSQAAHSRRETYIGTWLSEPMDPGGDPGLCAERGEALKLAILILLEKLSPTERAAYILREAFDYSHRQIADILQLKEANVRQLVSRARKHIADDRRTSVSSDEQRRFLEAFIAAAQKGDMAGLENLFIEDVVSCSDGSGSLCPAPAPVSGRRRWARVIADGDVVTGGMPRGTLSTANDLCARLSEPRIPHIFTSQQQEDSKFREEGATMTPNLVIVHSNPQPTRERYYPSTWLFYSQGQELQVQVEHDINYRPHVLDKGAA